MFCLNCKVILTQKNRYRNVKDTLCKPCYCAHKREQYHSGYKVKKSEIMKKYAKTPMGKLTRNTASRRARKKFPEKWEARIRLRYAVKVGKIIKPDVCDVSKFKGASPCNNNRIEAHHHRGYAGDHAFDVIWVCTKHHREFHKRTYGMAQHKD